MRLVCLCVRLQMCRQCAVGAGEMRAQSDEPSEVFFRGSHAPAFFSRPPINPIFRFYVASVKVNIQSFSLSPTSGGEMVVRALLARPKKHAPPPAAGRSPLASKRSPQLKALHPSPPLCARALTHRAQEKEREADREGRVTDIERRRRDKSATTRDTQKQQQKYHPARARTGKNPETAPPYYNLLRLKHIRV